MKASFAVIDLAPEANSQDVGGCIGDDALAIQTLPVPKNTAAIDGRQPSFQVTWAGSPDDIAEAQRLRFRVFVRELGARLSLPHDAPAEHDIDPFDAFCDHLLIRAYGGPQHGEVVATCRVLDPEGACKAGGLYADKEFDLAPLRDLLPHTVEMGRVCIDPAWRNGLLVMAMWRAVGETMTRRNLCTMIGCASVTLLDGGELAAQLWRRLKSTHLVPQARRIRPWTALRLGCDDDSRPAEVPTLMKGYLRCAGKLLGPPAIDEDFNTADFPMIVHLADLPSRYTKRVFASTE